MQAVRNALAGLGQGLSKITGWIYGKYDNNRQKCKGVLITLAVLVLLGGLITGSYKSVDSLSQGVPINYTSGTILDALVTNSGSFLGLNSYYYTLPATNFLLTFNTAQLSSDSPNLFPSVAARTVQGIKVELQVYAKVRVVADNLKSFLQEYGMGLVDGVHAGWQIYIKEKIRNVVVQSVAGYKFYQITNQALSANINAQFTSFITSRPTYPFQVSIVGINVRYPTNTIEVNNTLGIKLLKQSSRLSQLDSQLSLLNEYLNQYSPQIKNYVLKQATNDGMMASREESIKLDNRMWGQGLQLLNATLQNSTLIQKYLEVYFNTLYNVTYRTDLQPFII